MYFGVMGEDVSDKKSNKDNDQDGSEDRSARPETIVLVRFF